MVSSRDPSKGWTGDLQVDKKSWLESPGYGVVLPGFFFTTPKTQTQNMQMSLHYQPKLHALFWGKSFQNHHTTLHEL